ncbi:MAG: MFS transporter, partial [Nanoarchaeota archaeon]
MKFFAPKEWKLLWPFYTFSFLFSFAALSGSFIVIFYQNRGLTLTDVAMLWIIMAIVNFFAEVPTGVIADVLGRKTSTLIGLFGTGLIWITIPFIHTYNGFVIMISLLAIAQTFISGAKEAWVYDLLKQHKQQQLIKNYYAHTTFFKYAGFVIGPALASLLVPHTGIDFLFIIDGILSCFVTTILLFAPEYFSRASHTIRQHGAQTLHLAKKGFQFIKKNLAFKLMLTGSIGITGWSLIKELADQPYLVSVGMPVAYLGFFFSVLAIFTAISPLIGSYLVKKVGEKKLLIFMATTLTVLPLLLFLTK